MSGVFAVAVGVEPGDREPPPRVRPPEPGHRPGVGAAVAAQDQQPLASSHGRRDRLRLARQERGDLGAVLRPRVRVGLPARVDRDVAVVADLETAVTQPREQPEPPQVRRRRRHPDVALIGQLAAQRRRDAHDGEFGHSQREDRSSGPGARPKRDCNAWCRSCRPEGILQAASWTGVIRGFRFRMARFHVRPNLVKPSRPVARIHRRTHLPRTSRGPRPRGQPSAAGPQPVRRGASRRRDYTRGVTPPTDLRARATTPPRRARPGPGRRPPRHGPGGVPGGRPRGRRPDRRLPRDVERYAVFPAIEPGLDRAAASRPPRRRTPEPLDAILADYRPPRRARTPPHWQHPGFFAYFATTASGPGILGELLTAALGQNPMLWRTSPIGDRARGRRRRLAAPGARAARRVRRPAHRHGLDVVAHRARRRARGGRARRRGAGTRRPAGRAARCGSTPRRRPTPRSRRRA